MNWRKDWRRGVCTLLIVTAEAHRVYDATRPRTRKPGPGAAEQDEQLFVSKTKCLQPNFNTKFDSAGFGGVSSPCRVPHGEHKKAESLRGRSR
jgi:hypothetical protein